MNPALFVFWGGLVSLILVATLLADLDLNRMRARAPSSGATAAKDASGSVPSGWKLVHTIRRGAETVRVWNIEEQTHGDARHALTVERKDSRCGDCMACVNDAIDWMQRQEQSAGA
jgi:hypothetical protein